MSLTTRFGVAFAALCVLAAPVIAQTNTDPTDRGVTKDLLNQPQYVPPPTTSGEAPVAAGAGAATGSAAGSDNIPDTKQRGVTGDLPDQPQYVPPPTAR